MAAWIPSPTSPFRGLPLSWAARSTCNSSLDAHSRNAVLFPWSNISAEKTCIDPLARSGPGPAGPDITWDIMCGRSTRSMDLMRPGKSCQEVLGLVVPALGVSSPWTAALMASVCECMVASSLSDTACSCWSIASQIIAATLYKSICRSSCGLTGRGSFSACARRCWPRRWTVALKVCPRWSFPVLTCSTGGGGSATKIREGRGGSSLSVLEWSSSSSGVWWLFKVCCTRGGCTVRVRRLLRSSDSGSTPVKPHVLLRASALSALVSLGGA
mmetsp:Transcript_63657/g.170565  ORF Transcript_63657/g.170565 Transcript_63657/m.170565 type:complete len:271 (-) Transcript_63657:25-837(-)